MGTILAIDPGNIKSGYVVVEHDGEEIRRLQSRLWQKRKRAIRLRAITMRTHRTRPCLPTISRARSCWTLSRQMPQKSRP